MSIADLTRLLLGIPQTDETPQTNEFAIPQEPTLVKEFEGYLRTPDYQVSIFLDYDWEILKLWFSTCPWQQESTYGNFTVTDTTWLKDPVRKILTRWADYQVFCASGSFSDPKNEYRSSSVRFIDEKKSRRFCSFVDYLPDTFTPWHMLDENIEVAPLREMIYLADRAIAEILIPQQAKLGEFYTQYGKRKKPPYR